MELQITAPDDVDGGDLTDLRDWLGDDDGMRGVPVSLHRSGGRPGEMAGGGVADVLLTLFDDRTTVIAVSTAVAGWLTARASSRRTRVKVRHGDREMEIDSTTVRDPELLARRMREELWADDPRERPPAGDPSEES